LGSLLSDSCQVARVQLLLRLRFSPFGRRLLCPVLLYFFWRSAYVCVLFIPIVVVLSCVCVECLGWFVFDDEGDFGDFGEKSTHPKSLWTNRVFFLLWSGYVRLRICNTRL
jgi:hypothetical protein